MFDLCDWNDSLDAPSLPESLVSAQGEGAQKEKVASSRKKRLKRTRQLIQILRSLETPHLQESKDNESPPDVILKKKPKRAEAQEPRLNNNVQPTNNEVQTTAVGSHSAPADTGPRLSRQQWRNKQKNKKRNKNKFKQLMDPVVQKEGTVKRKVVGEGTKEEVAGLEKGESKHLDGATTSAIHTEGKSTAKEAAVWSKGSKNNGLSDKVTTQEKQRLQKIKKILERGKADKSHIDQKKETEMPTDCVEEEAMDDKSSLLRSRMEERLSSGRFRFLNQQLYTSHSHEALRLFQDDPEAFTVYHNGFSRQVQHWPVNPVTEILKYIKNRPPRLVVADFGCGDALIARSVRNEVHSFDLVALNDHVTVCDMAEVPLSDETVDIAVFCLSLMGKNLGDFLQEANRVLKMGGILLVAEVSSRFSDIRQFLNAMSLLGFKNVAKNTDNSYFYLFEFNKTSLGKDCSKHPGLQLTPCLYKKR